MTIFRNVLAELVGMFLSDIRLSGAILIVVAVAAGVIEIASVEPLIGGGVLLFGSLAVVLVAVRLAVQPHGGRKEETAHRDIRPHRPNRHPVELRRDGLFGRASMWLGRLRQRRDLKRLDDRLLDDIGIGKDAAEAESRRLD